MRLMTEQPPVLAVTGIGAYRIRVRLEPVPHLRHGRGWPEAISAATLTGADFNADHDRGLSRFEARIYAPPGFEDSDRDRCTLASFEFHHMVLDSARGGIMDFTGVLVGALAYPQNVYDRLAAGTPLTDIDEARGNWPGDVRYLPHPHTNLERYLGWRAKLTISPLRRQDDQ
ncbi:hypothetical protein HMI59_23870 (plasmid) [Paenarthrobacter sp. YJN-5]|nr:hypothetical protein HMI59_23870 [Paenarthrobacter sp. YJN-5]